MGNARKANDFVQGIKNMSDMDFLTHRLNRQLVAQQWFLILN